LNKKVNDKITVSIPSGEKTYLILAILA